MKKRAILANLACSHSVSSSRSELVVTGRHCWFHVAAQFTSVIPYSFTSPIYSFAFSNYVVIQHVQRFTFNDIILRCEYSRTYVKRHRIKRSPSIKRSVFKVPKISCYKVVTSIKRSRSPFAKSQRDFFYCRDLYFKNGHTVSSTCSYSFK